MSLCIETEQENENLPQTDIFSQFSKSPIDTFFYGIDLKDDRLFHVSSSACRVIGYDNTDIIKNGLNWFVQQIHPEDLTILNRLTDEDNDPEIMPEIKYRFRDKNGSYCRLYENRCLLYDSDGTPSFLIGRIEKA